MQSNSYSRSNGHPWKINLQEGIIKTTHRTALAWGTPTDPHALGAVALHTAGDGMPELNNQHDLLQMFFLVHLLLGSRGPSTVILMALWYVATCGGFVKTVIVSVKLFPAKGEKVTEHMYWEHVVLSNRIRTHQMTLTTSCPYLQTDMKQHGLTTVCCWMHSLCGNCSKHLEKKINLYVNVLHFVCKIRRLPLTVTVYLIY